MKTTEIISALRHNLEQARNQGKKIVLIPTMGFLHQGHLSMVEAAGKQELAKEKNIYTVMSIFVNPLQFGPSEDYEKYPRDIDLDSRLAREAGVDMLFVPSVREMYPEGKSLTAVDVSELTSGLCGAGRPGHFQGVATVVTKLFNIVLPDLAYFGQKDYQQCAVIKQMVRDLNIPVKILVFPIVREDNGLAMSSRNAYLNSKELAEAPVLYRALLEGKARILAGERNSCVIRDTIMQRISNESCGKIEYVEIRNAENLKDLTIIECPAVIALAVSFGGTRLIDNILVEA